VPLLAMLAGLLGRQALHAAVLEFEHPHTGARLRFETAPPADMASVIAELRQSTHASPRR
jgi:23S rRNA pseudouridine1911/1915/1917 synthase